MSTTFRVITTSPPETPPAGETAIWSPFFRRDGTVGYLPCPDECVVEMLGKRYHLRTVRGDDALPRAYHTTPLQAEEERLSDQEAEEADR